MLLEGTTAPRQADGRVASEATWLGNMCPIGSSSDSTKIQIPKVAKKHEIRI